MLENDEALRIDEDLLLFVQELYAMHKMFMRTPSSFPLKDYLPLDLQDEEDDEFLQDELLHSQIRQSGFFGMGRNSSNNNNFNTNNPNNLFVSQTMRSSSVMVDASSKKNDRKQQAPVLELPPLLA